MARRRYLTAAIATVSLLGVSACVTDPNTGEKKVSRTVLGTAGGAAAGYLLGGIIGGKTARIIGAGVGGAAGGVVGYKMDQQIKELKEQTAGSGIDVTDEGDYIKVNLPDGVTFATDSATISPAFKSVLDDIAASLIQYPDSLVDVYGFTDSTGSEAYNLQLSERRAKAVADYLIYKGVPAARLATKGFGEDPNYFVASNDTAEGRSLNRRVEIKIVPITQEDVQAAQGN
ncbi:OmpA family protein [Croceicoccus gelatinilyticus]|uniref:OmpA family protein n=1 Tax=Croceicoccus gelatinilyticus TaxID=2835536 RepID=UPI001BCAA7FB|nr:OmpA family protein [Croceicoccus gelatinilyticus]MBS7669516.1 OmpA family protein [Croceicoccus gelatinilyticus]